ncbi:uncharacterized protein BBA_08031 [Beauveria bassiana ARSEF 2860]|uniref:Bacteriophage T5 Orf172 DNA-binding domain-containing protein n=1 Tax=Beauveria bassiana (strain ARSEF 2860) TaxID=655819 RepID=J4VXA3_BEAB2|nr:uncharacterized protein BBA_08031 [Beauveria bassiana ARSEF 2860]EJP63020.1 hypothetical protein BBA_08031 [Beauveria bassiana ARSEF 2860]
MHATSTLFWPNSAEKMREALHVSAEEPLLCCGRTAKKKCCSRTISKANRSSIQHLLSDVVASGSWSAAKELFERLSKLVLCQGKRFGHQKQCHELLVSWQRTFAETELRHALGKLATEPATTVNKYRTIKFEAVDANTHTIPAAVQKLAVKFEPDEEYDFSSLYEIPDLQEDTKPAHIFVPYGKTQTQLQINKAIQKIIEKPLTPKEKKSLSKSGGVYIYRLPNTASGEAPDLKIGSTTDYERRMKEWRSSCGYNPEKLSIFYTSLYRRVERLVHAQLGVCRKREAKCPGCGVSHQEFFGVRRYQAAKLIGLWSEWMGHVPYDEDGTLNAEWRKKLEGVDLDDADCWESFTAKE